MLKPKLVTYIFIFLCSFLQTPVQAQVREVLDAVKPKKEFKGTPILQKGSQILQVGFGTPNNVASLLDIGGLSSFFQTSSSNKIGPVFLSYEYLIKDNIGLGASLSYAKAKRTYTDPLSSSSFIKYHGELSGISLLLSSTYHFYITDKIDPYAKGSIGATLWKGSYTNQNGEEQGKVNLPTPIGYSALLGLRYFVSPTVAPFGEVSYSNFRFTVNMGAAFKLK